MSNTTIGGNSLSNMSGLSEAELARRAEQMVDVKTGKISALSALDAALVDATVGQKATQGAFSAMAAATASPHAIEEPTHAFSHATAKAGFAPEAPAPPSIGGPGAALEKASKAGAKRISGFCGGGYPPPPPPPAAAPPPPPPALTSPETGKAPPVAATPPSQDITAPSDNAPPKAPTAPNPPAAPATGAPVQAGPLSVKRANVHGAVRGGFLDGAGGTPATAGGAAPSAGPTAGDMTSARSDLEGNSMNMQFEMLKMQMQKMAQIQDCMSNVSSTMSEQGMTAIRNAKA